MILTAIITTKGNINNNTGKADTHSQVWHTDDGSLWNIYCGWICSEHLTDFKRKALYYYKENQADILSVSVAKHLPYLSIWSGMWHSRPISLRYRLRHLPNSGACIPARLAPLLYGNPIFLPAWHLAIARCSDFLMLYAKILLLAFWLFMQTFYKLLRMPAKALLRFCAACALRAPF